MPTSPGRRRLLTLLVAAAGLCAVQTSAASAATLDLETLSGIEAEKMMQAGTLTSVDLTKAYIDRINALNKRGPGLNAVTQFNKDALVEAAAVDKARAEGKDLGPAMGLPILLKDIVDAKGMYTSAGNYSTRNSYPAEDSGVAKKLREHGVIILGKLGLSEWANSFGNQPSGFSNLTGQVINGIDADQNPSGSSSGSGAAGAAALSALTIGTETSGSIISPSSTQGIVGLRPTVGLVPGYGIAPISASQDTAGPMVRSVADAAITLQSIAGPDPQSDGEYSAVFGPNYLATGVIPTPPSAVPDYLSALDLDFVKGKRIGYNGTLTAGSPLKIAYDALVAAGAIMVSDPSTTVGTIPSLPSGYEQHKTIDEYYKHLGPDVPIKSLVEEVADNQANTLEALKFGNATHLSASLSDISAGSSNETTYRTNLPIRKAAYHAAIDAMMNMGTPNDPSDDVIAVLGSTPSSPQAGYPQITIPMGYNTTFRRTLNVSVNGGAYDERDLIGVAYVIEQATKLRQPASQVNPSMYRCAKTVPAPPYSSRGGCNPDYDTIMAKVGSVPDLGFSLEDASIKSLQSRIAAGTLTSEKLTRAYLARIALTNAEGPATQAVRSVNLDAIAQAKALDAKNDGTQGPLYGIPVLLDDSIDVTGTPTTVGSIALQKSLPTADAKLVAKLKAAGAIILGKTNVTELNGLFDGNIPEGYSSLGGQVLVPSDTDKTPAGSSAGSSAATASGLAAATIGLETSTDTAQLIAPAGVNGVVGLKPTVGLVSRTGVLGVAKSQDAPGPIAKTVWDAAATLQTIAGRDSADSATSSAPIGTNYLSGLTTTALNGKRVAVISSTTAPYPTSISTVQDLGATTNTVTPGTVSAASIVTSEFKRDVNAYLAAGHSGGATSLQGIIDYDNANPVEGLKYQQGELVAAQAIDLTDSATNATYTTNLAAGKTQAQGVINTILASNDVIMVPSGNALVNVADRAGYPVLTVPAGYGTGGSGRNPIGVTFIGGSYSEASLLAYGYAYEQATKVRLAPSYTNPSMWRCVPGSVFYTAEKCHPGDRAYTQAFTPIPADVPAAATPAAPAAPTPAPAAADVPDLSKIVAALNKIADTTQLKALKAKLKYALPKSGASLVVGDTFNEAGSAKYTLALTYPKVKGKKTKKPVAVGVKTITVTKPGVNKATIKIASKSRAVLKKYPKAKVTLTTVFTSKATKAKLTTARAVGRG